MRPVRALGLVGLLVVASGAGSAPAGAQTASAFRFADAEIEASEGQSLVRVVVRRTSLPVGRATVDYRTEPGTATDGADYHGASGTLVFDVGASTASFPLLLEDDDVEEDARERLTVVLSDGGTTDLATVTILDDDRPLQAAGAATGGGSATPSSGASAGPVAPGSGPGPAAAAPAAPRTVAARPRAAVASPARRVTVRQSPITPFELRPVVPADGSGGGGSGTSIDPLFAVVAGLLLARVAAEVWFRSRIAAA